MDHTHHLPLSYFTALLYCMVVNKSSEIKTHSSEFPGQECAEQKHVK